MNSLRGAKLDFKTKQLSYELEQQMIKEDKGLKRLWNALVAKWVGVRKDNDMICLRQYNI